MRKPIEPGWTAPPNGPATAPDPDDDRIPLRAVALLASIMFGMAFVGTLSYVLPAGDDSLAAELLVDRNTRIFPYPFTIQNMMWMAFFTAVGELVVRHIHGNRERSQIGMRLLPQDADTAFTQKDLGVIADRVRASDPGERYLLQRILVGLMTQYRNTGSIEQVNQSLNLSLELHQHELELRYSMLRYVVWLIPTMGFIGTVLGIAFALRTAGSLFSGAAVSGGGVGPEMMERVTGDLGVAFYTTLLALLQSAVLMFAMHIMQSREEGVLNRIGQYTMNNLVSRLRQ